MPEPKTVLTRYVVPVVFSFMREKSVPLTKADIVGHIEPILSGMGYRARKMGHPYGYETDRALKTLLHKALVAQAADEKWILTRLGMERPKKITIDEAGEMVKDRIHFEKSKAN